MIFESLWFFLPILVANQCPGIASHFDLPGSKFPVNSKWFGENKTLAAYYFAPAVTIVFIYAQSVAEWSSTFGLFNYKRSDLWLVGLLFGLGAVLGDHVKSFIKRRIGRPPGAPWWPFDQLDFMAGGILLSLPAVGWIGFERILIIILFVLIIHPIGNTIGYLLKLRKVPW